MALRAGPWFGADDSRPFVPSEASTGDRPQVRRVGMVGRRGLLPGPRRPFQPCGAEREQYAHRPTDNVTHSLTRQPAHLHQHALDVDQ